MTMTDLAQMAKLRMRRAVADPCENRHQSEMSKSLSTADAIIAGARNKAEAARARSRADAATGKPREVIMAACEAIAAALEGDGFNFLCSGPGLKRVDGDLSFHIHFQSDRNNIAPQRAAVWIHGSVRSAALAKWRRARPVPWSVSDGPEVGLVTGGQIGNLADKPAWLEWDFADGTRRADEIADAVATIRHILLPFFALFADPARAIGSLCHNPVLSQSSLLEYAIAVLGREAAEAAGRKLLDGDPQLRKSFDDFALRFRENGLPRFTGSQASDLAAVALADGLDLAHRA